MGSIEEVMQLCRLCLVKDEVNVPIFDENSDIRQIVGKINSCLPVKVAHDDNLPKKICEGCSYKLEMLYMFQNTSLESEKQLLSWLSEAGVSLSSKTDGAHKPDILVKQEKFDASETQLSGDVGDISAGAHNYIKQQQKLPYQQEFAFAEASVSNEVEEEPAPKRSKRNVGAKKQVVEDDEDFTATLRIAKTEDDDSDELDQSEFIEAPSTSADDQPGPSGLGKGALEAPMSSSISKAKERSWDEASMFKAIRMVRDLKMSNSESARLCNVPRSTLSRLCLKPEKALDIKPGRKVLSDQAEKELVKYILLLQSKFYGLTKNDVRRIAYILAKRNNASFGRVGLVGRKWFNLFLERNKKTLPSTLACAPFGFSRKNVGTFFNRLEEVYRKYRYLANQVYAVDETCLTVIESKIPKVHNFTGKVTISELTLKERQFLMTTVNCMSATGHFVPPYIILPRKNISPRLMKGCPPEFVGVAHPSGWIQMNTFIDWFKHFVKHTNASPESRVLLILDGQYSHSRNIDLIELARQHYVELVSIPPQTTHKLQPLAKTFIEPLKTHYEREIRTWTKQNRQPLTSFDTVKLFGQAYSKVQTCEIAINGFLQTGIWPFNKHLFGDDDFMAMEYIISQVKENKRNKSAKWRNASVSSAIATSYDTELVVLKREEEVDKTTNSRGAKRKTYQGNQHDRDGRFYFDTDIEPDILLGQTSPNSAEAECMFCDRLFSQDSHKQLWVMCLLCGLWAHNDCANPEVAIWFCNFCK